jgi:O-antigen biosynthesis protein
LFVDGTLQEAGGMLFEDGSAANFGRGDPDIDDPIYNFVREVDYCSGALLATRRDVFEQLGRFDSRYAPAYNEDSDYCFSLRQAGYRVYYQPACTIVHIEGVSSGRDLTAGVKQYQVVNKQKFVAKWFEELRQQPQRPSEDDAAAWRALALQASVSEVVG